MTTTITPGRWRGLKTTSSDQSIFTIVAFDQRGSYRKMLPENTTYNEAVRIKRTIVSALSVRASAFLLDAQYGLHPALDMSGSCGLLLSYEKSGYTGDSTYRRVAFDPDWTLAKIKRVGASAVKMLVYYHPDAGELADELDQLIANVANDCHQLDLPLFLEPMSYSIDATIGKDSDAFAKIRPQVVRDTAKRLSKAGADILKLEFPHDAAFNQDLDEWRAACEAISTDCAVPWVLLSAGVDFETFAQQAQIACEAGASGFLAGRAIWKEAVTMTDAERAQFLEVTALPRLEQLITTAHDHARPWSDFYSYEAPSEEWFKTYAAD
ncbi:MAG: tagatose 1,6-diphosphate aldolase [Chloroflexi bacterium]|nr:tagatose 1,6-diphosphate aldolase [Chloroflexota bacterium]